MKKFHILFLVWQLLCRCLPAQHVCLHIRVAKCNNTRLNTIVVGIITICVIPKNKDHGYLKNKGAIMTITYKKLIEYVLSDEYSQKVYSIIEERAHRLIEDDGCDDERKYTHWEQNPFCVEDQLIGNSSGYYEDDDAFDRAFEDAKETVSEDCCDELTEPETISKFLEECSKEDENWVLQLIDYVIEQQ